MRTSFRDLLVWQETFRLATAVCKVVRRFDRLDRIDIGSQLIRSSVSVPSNIAEGSGRQGAGDQIRFYLYARGSLNELETQFEIASELGLIPSEEVPKLRSLISSSRRGLSGLIRSLRTRTRTEN